jgi:AcrR family transcriptional regulator
MAKVASSRTEVRREESLHAAIVGFARNGFHQTTMANMVAEAGITAGASYRYFASKEEVIEACAQARGQAQEELHPAMEPGAAARLLVAAYVGLLVQKVMDPDVDVPRYAEP